MEDIVKKGYSALIAGEDFTEGHVSIHPNYISDVIGKNGCCIKAIQEQLGIRMTVPSESASGNASTIKITVAGPKEKVVQAKAVVKEITQYYHSEITHPGFIHEELEDVPASAYNIIIGPKGSEIRHIEGNFKVSVHIPNPNTVTQNVLVVGLPRNVEGAAAYIRKIVSQSTKSEAAASDAFAWTDPAEEEETQEPWMEQYVHPSSRENPPEATLPPAKPVSAWSAAVSYSEGW